MVHLNASQVAHLDIKNQFYYITHTSPPSVYPR